MKKKPTNTQESLERFLKDLTAKRLRKKLALTELFKAARVSMRDWHAWTKVLDKGQKRSFPNPNQRRKLHAALIALPKRPKLIRGRPPGPSRVKETGVKQ